MNKLNIKLEKKELSDQDIIRHKDFDALLRSYKMVKPPLYKSARFISAVSVVSAAAVIAFLYFSVFHKTGDVIDPVINPNTELSADNQAALPHNISPPFASLNLKPELYVIDAKKGANITNKNGSRIHVPAKAFKDQQGKPVAGNVELRYREFHNPVDLFLSGVPTQYDSAGQTYHFQSGGMMEITAYQGDKPVLLENGKEIEVEMTTLFPGQYNLYYFDTVKKQWINQGKNQLIAEHKDTPPAAVKRDTEADNFVMPVLPRKADRKKNPFNIDANYSDFPEIAEYKNVLWEVDESYQKLDPRIFDVHWQKVSLDPSGKAGNYYITFMRNDSSFTLLAYPVFDNKSYTQALTLYNEKLQAYNAALEKQKKQNTANNASAIKPGDESGQDIQMEQGQLNYSELRPMGKRVITVLQMGYYSCDIPVASPSGPGIHPVFTDVNGDAIKNSKVFVADRSRNLLYNFGQSLGFTFSRRSANLLWIVTPEGKIGILSTESFAALTRDNDAPVFRFNLSDPEAGVNMLKGYFNI